MATAYASGGVVVVGLGADGWAGLGDEARHALREAGTVIGSPRQLDLLPVWLGAARVAWRSPHRGAVRALVDEYASTGVAVLASGDPMMYGLGRTLVDELGIDRLHILPHPSSVSLACARLGWPVEGVEVVNAVGGGLQRIHDVLRDGALLMILSAGRDTPRAVAELLRRRGYGASLLTVLGDLGSARESRVSTRAADWDVDVTAGLNILAVHAVRDPQTPGSLETNAPPPGESPPRFADLITQCADQARAAVLSLLAPAPGELLWEVGGGELAPLWERSHPACRALSVSDGAGVESLSAPDAVVITSVPASVEVIEACWRVLRPGGRLVVVATTLQEAARLVDVADSRGGTLQRLDLAVAVPAGAGSRWRPEAVLVLWRDVKPPQGG